MLISWSLRPTLACPRDLIYDAPFRITLGKATVGPPIATPIFSSALREPINQAYLGVELSRDAKREGMALLARGTHSYKRCLQPASVVAHEFNESTADVLALPLLVKIAKVSSRRKTAQRHARRSRTEEENAILTVLVSAIFVGSQLLVRARLSCDARNAS